MDPLTLVIFGSLFGGWKLIRDGQAEEAILAEGETPLGYKVRDAIEEARKNSADGTIGAREYAKILNSLGTSPGIRQLAANQFHNSAREAHRRLGRYWDEKERRASDPDFQEEVRRRKAEQKKRNEEWKEKAREKARGGFENLKNSGRARDGWGAFKKWLGDRAPGGPGGLDVTARGSASGWDWRQWTGDDRGTGDPSGRGGFDPPGPGPGGGGHRDGNRPEVDPGPTGGADPGSGNGPESEPKYGFDPWGYPIDDPKVEHERDRRWEEYREWVDGNRSVDPRTRAAPDYNAPPPRAGRDPEGPDVHDADWWQPAGEIDTGKRALGPARPGEPSPGAAPAPPEPAAPAPGGRAAPLLEPAPEAPRTGAAPAPAATATIERTGGDMADKPTQDLADPKAVMNERAKGEGGGKEVEKKERKNQVPGKLFGFINPGQASLLAREIGKLRHGIEKVQGGLAEIYEVTGFLESVRTSPAITELLRAFGTMTGNNLSYCDHVAAALDQAEREVGAAFRNNPDAPREGDVYN